MTSDPNDTDLVGLHAAFPHGGDDAAVAANVGDDEDSRCAEHFSGEPELDGFRDHRTRTG